MIAALINKMKNAIVKEKTEELTKKAEALHQKSQKTTTEVDTEVKKPKKTKARKTKKKSSNSEEQSSNSTL